MKKRTVRFVLLVPLIFILSVYTSFEQKIVPAEKVVLAENVIIHGPYVTPKLSDYDWTDEVPYKLDIPSRNKLDSKTYHDFKHGSSNDIPWPLEWPSRYENDGGEQFLPNAKPEDKKPKFIPIEPIGKKYKFLLLLWKK